MCLAVVWRFRYKSRCICTPSDDFGLDVVTLTTIRLLLPRLACQLSVFFPKHHFNSNFSPVANTPPPPFLPAPPSAFSVRIPQEHTAAGPGHRPPDPRTWDCRWCALSRSWPLCSPRPPPPRERISIKLHIPLLNNPAFG